MRVGELQRLVIDTAEELSSGVRTILRGRSGVRMPRLSARSAWPTVHTPWGLLSVSGGTLMTPLQLLPFLPAAAQREALRSCGLGEAACETLRASRELDVPEDLFLVKRKLLSAGEISALAACCSNPAVLELLVSDRRVSVRDALARNRRLSPLSAVELLNITLAERSACRWGRVRDLLVRLAEHGGLSVRLGVLAGPLLAYCEEFGDVPAPLVASILTRATFEDVRDLLLDERFWQVSNRRPLHLLTMWFSGTSQDDWDAGHDKLLLEAVRAEVAGCLSGRWQPTAGLANLGELLRHRIVTLSAEACWSYGEVAMLASLLGRTDAPSAAALLAGDLLQGRSDHEFDLLVSRLIEPCNILMDLLEACCLKGVKLPVRRAFVEAIDRAAAPQLLPSGLLQALEAAEVLEFSPDAVEQLAHSARSTGMDLLVLLARFAGVEDAALSARFAKVEVGSLVRHWSASAGLMVRLQAKVVAVQSGASTAEVCIKLHRSSPGTALRLFVAELLASGEVSLADLSDCPELAAAALSSTFWPKGECAPWSGADVVQLSGRFQRLLKQTALQESLSSQPAPIGVLVALVESASDDEVAALVVDANLVAEFLLGELPVTLSHSRAEATLRNLSTREHTSQAWSGLAGLTELFLSDGSQVDWPQLLAGCVPVPVMRQLGSSNMARLGAALLASELSKEPSAWSAALALWGSWEGTVFDLAQTSRSI